MAAASGREYAARLSVTKPSFMAVSSFTISDKAMIPEPVRRRNPKLALDGGGRRLYGKGRNFPRF